MMARRSSTRRALKANAADDARAWLAEHTAGSGAYMLQRWQKGQQLVLVPNPHFSGTKPTFKRVTVKIIGESAARRLQLTKGRSGYCRCAAGRPVCGPEEAG